MQGGPTCAKCDANAAATFTTYKLNVTGQEVQKEVVLIYCTNCGAVQGVLNK